MSTRPNPPPLIGFNCRLTRQGKIATFRRVLLAEIPRRFAEGKGVIQVSFTANIQRHVTCPPKTVVGRTVGEVLNSVFALNERARGYILDDQGGLRKHMVVFVNGQPVRDRSTLSDAVPDGAEVYVMQALSGG